MKRNLFGLLISLSLALSAQAQSIQALFYNTENLFDTLDHPGKLDEDFTPFGKHEHSADRYAIKIDHLGKVINAAFDQSCPSVIGLCEVENVQVVNDLKAVLDCADQYAIVHQESSDIRGIDNALLYDTTMFLLIEEGAKAIDLGEGERPTRDILWAKLEHKLTTDRFYVYVNHWPSRYGGKELTEGKRMKASQALNALILAHRSQDEDVHSIVLGDLNDHPQDPSVQAIVNCDTGACLENVMEHVQTEGRGTHAYRGDWGVLDHILVDQALIKSERGWHVDRDGAEPVSFEWMMYEHEDSGDLFPSRFYGSNAYFGGYSDHLPVKAVLNYSD